VEGWRSFLKDHFDGGVRGEPGVGEQIFDAPFRLLAGARLDRCGAVDDDPC
jgi:hypothetical protein